MNLHSFMRVTLFLVFIFFVEMLSAQVQLRTYFDRDTFFLGDTVGLQYEVLTFPNTEIVELDLSPLDSVYSIEQMQQAISDTSINWNKIYDSKNQFEINDYGNWIASENNNKLSASKLKWQGRTGQEAGQKIFSNRLVTTFWSEGTYIVPDVKIIYKVNNQIQSDYISGAGNRVVVTAPNVLQVSTIDTLTQLTPIKPISERKMRWTDFMVLYILVGVAILGYLLFRYFKKQKIKEEEVVEEPEVILPPHIIALEKLEKLKSEQLWQKGAVKEYQSRLTYTLREYLENRYDTQALESTTAQIIEDLRKLDVTQGQRDKIKELLQVADLVKFAKAEPPEEFHARVMQESFAFIEQTKQIEVQEETETSTQK